MRAQSETKLRDGQLQDPRKDVIANKAQLHLQGAGEPEKRADSFNAGMIQEDDIIIMTSGSNWRLL